MRVSSRFVRLGRELLIIALSALTIYFLVCLGTYSAEDPAWSFSGSGDEIRNLGGRFGAWFADLILNALGYSGCYVKL